MYSACPAHWNFFYFKTVGLLGVEYELWNSPLNFIKPLFYALTTLTFLLHTQNTLHLLFLHFLWLIDWLIMSMGWDCVSELRPPMGLLFIPQVIYERGEPWWNNISRENLIHPPKLSCNSTSSHLVANQEELSEGND